jgi:hypothetical protein
MGLTIHYKLRLASATTRQAHAMVQRLRRRALDLPFERVSPIATYSVRDARGFNDAPPWLRQEIEWQAREERGYLVVPQRAVGFWVQPGPGCESGRFGLMQYPRAVVRPGGRRVPTTMSGWRWQDFCKTQYASNPRYGGFENFRRCHVSLIALLDEAAKIGLRTHVVDESGFATRRDVDHLALEVAEWNEMIAGFAGRLKDGLAGEFDAPIMRFPDFEHLEARGRDEGRHGAE